MITVQIIVAAVAMQSCGEVTAAGQGQHMKQRTSEIAVNLQGQLSPVNVHEHDRVQSWRSERTGRPSMTIGRSSKPGQCRQRSFRVPPSLACCGALTTCHRPPARSAQLVALPADSEERSAGRACHQRPPSPRSLLALRTYHASLRQDHLWRCSRNPPSEASARD